MLGFRAWSDGVKFFFVFHFIVELLGGAAHMQAGKTHDSCIFLYLYDPYTRSAVAACCAGVLRRRAAAACRKSA